MMKNDASYEILDLMARYENDTEAALKAETSPDCLCLFLLILLQGSGHKNKVKPFPRKLQGSCSISWLILLISGFRL